MNYLYSESVVNHSKKAGLGKLFCMSCSYFENINYICTSHSGNNTTCSDAEGIIKPPVRGYA